MRKSRNSNPWFSDWFQEDYLILYRHRDVKEARQFLDRILPELEPRPSGRILDVGCGAGRHVHYLASLGMPVLGLDLSRPLLTLASIHSPSPDLLWIQADMRTMPFHPRAFSIAVNLFTSFGYFLDDRDNELVIKEISRVLQPGGWLVLDTLNPPEVSANLVPENQRQEGVNSIIERRIIDHDTHRVIKTIHIERDNRRETYLESVRMYEVQEIHQLIEAAGLTPRLLWGDYQGSEYHTLSPRIIIAAQAHETDTL